METRIGENGYIQGNPKNLVVFSYKIGRKDVEIEFQDPFYLFDPKITDELKIQNAKRPFGLVYRPEKNKGDYGRYYLVVLTGTSGKVVDAYEKTCEKQGQKFYPMGYVPENGLTEHMKNVVFLKIKELHNK